MNQREQTSLSHVLFSPPTWFRLGRKMRWHIQNERRTRLVSRCCFDHLINFGPIQLNRHLIIRANSANTTGGSQLSPESLILLWVRWRLEMTLDGLSTGLYWIDGQSRTQIVIEAVKCKLNKASFSSSQSPAPQIVTSSTIQIIKIEIVR